MGFSLIEKLCNSTGSVVSDTYMTVCDDGHSRSLTICGSDGDAIRTVTAWSQDRNRSGPRSASPEVGGVGFDEATGRLFIAERLAGPFGEGIIHVYRLGAVAAIFADGFESGDTSAWPD